MFESGNCGGAVGAIPVLIYLPLLGWPASLVRKCVCQSERLSKVPTEVSRGVRCRECLRVP